MTEPHQQQSLISQPQKQQQQPEHDDRAFFNLIKKAGLEGRYQTILSIIMCVSSYLTGGLVLITPYLFYQDPYICDGKHQKECFDFVCGLDPTDRMYYIPDPSIYTLSNKFGDFRCDSQKNEIDLVMTIMYIGNVVGFLIVALIGDLVGRKFLMMCNLITALIGLAITILCVNLTMAAAGLFLMTLGIQNSFNICFYFISQTMSQQRRQKLQVIIQMFFGMGVLINVLWYFSVGDWQLIFAIFYFIPLVLVVLSFIFFVRDTPMCLVMRNNTYRALKEFTFIAKLNNNKFDVSLKQLAQIKASYQHKLKGNSTEKKKSFSIIDLFRYNSLRMKTILLIIVQCTVIFAFYAPALMLDKFNLSLYINGLVVGVSQIISYPVAFVMITRITRKKTAYGCFATTLLCSIVLIFIWDQGNDNASIAGSIGVLVLIFVFRFAISLEYTVFYIYFNQVYPTQIRVLGTGLVSTMGGVMVTVAPQIIQACISGGFPIMIVFAILSGISIFLSSRLPQTLHVPPHDEIEELRKVDAHVSKEQLQALMAAEKQLAKNESLMSNDKEPITEQSN